jgi:YidC/Oxa1 family membrane protein insertase
LQPLIKDLQRKYGDDRQLLSAETMKLYQEHRVNPFGSCLPILVQMPVFFALYYAIINISQSPAYQDAAFSKSFLWLPDLSLPDPLYLLPFIVAGTQFIQQRMAMPQRLPGQQLDPQQAMMNNMLQIMPLMVGFFAWQFAAGPVIYWITQNVFSAIQQYFITGFGSLRDLPGMAFLPVPPWAKPPTVTGAASSKVIVTTSKPGATPPTPAQPSGLMGRLYQQINKRVQEVEEQRNGATGGQPAKPGPTPPTRSSASADEGDGPARRSSRRARPKR